MRPVLAKGAKGPEVAELQRLLNQNGMKLTADGDFGAKTETALKDLQISYGLVQTGKADAATWGVLDLPAFWTQTRLRTMNMPPTPTVTGDGKSSVFRAWNTYGSILTEMATALGFRPAAAAAVLAVESAGKGMENNRMVIRFENHIFEARWGRANQTVFDQHFKGDAAKPWTGHQWRPDPNQPWQKQHETGQDGEWAVLTYARTLDDEAALKSISMGAPQVMGFNHLQVGYPSARAMFDEWSTGDRPQILGLFDFIRSNHKMVRALRAQDWVGFATIYNGPGQPSVYGSHIESSYNQARKYGVP